MPLCASTNNVEQRRALCSARAQRDVELRRELVDVLADVRLRIFQLQSIAKFDDAIPCDGLYVSDDLNEALKGGTGVYAEAVADLVFDVRPDGQSTLLGEDLFAIA